MTKLNQGTQSIGMSHTIIVYKCLLYYKVKTPAIFHAKLSDSQIAKCKSIHVKMYFTCSFVVEQDKEKLIFMWNILHDYEVVYWTKEIELSYLP